MALRKARAYSPDVVNTHNITGFSPTIFSAIRRSGFPLVHTLHDQYLLCPKTTMYRNSNCSKPCLSCKPYASLRSSQAHTDLVVGVSKFILQRHRQFGAFENTPERVIYNSAPSWPSDIRRSTAKPLRFGYLGQIRPTKGLHVLIQAFMEEQLTNAELHIAGKGDAEYETNLRQLTESHTNIRWLGYSESKSFLESIDILVVPSLWNDTAPLVVMEAYSAGRPVLASRRGGIPELVTPETGWTFDPDDKRELRTMLRRCWSNPDGLIKMGENAKSVAKSYSTDRFLDAYEEAYASVKTRTL